MKKLKIYFKSEKFKKFWCRFRHTATRYDIDGKWHCEKCKLSWDWLPDFISTR